jgi:hypothetical protein
MRARSVSIFTNLLSICVNSPEEKILCCIFPFKMKHVAGTLNPKKKKKASKGIPRLL